MSFVRRAITVIFSLGTGTFGEDGQNTVTVSGLRVQAQIDKVVGPGMGTVQMRIYGLPPQIINQLTALNQAAATIKQNSVTILAGDYGTTLSTVFQGQIIVAQQNLNGAPETSLLIVAQAGALAAIQSVTPSSYPGSADAGVIMQDIATEAGWHFENNGVNFQVSTQYLPGSPRDKAQRVAEAGKFNWIVDDGGNSKIQTLAIWPMGGTRGGAIPIISSATGMIGYPDYSTSLTGLEIRTLFNPQLFVGGQVQVKSDLFVANGVFGTFEISHTLESETPGGQWMTKFSTTPLASAAQ